ncbi:MAG TPA: BlaI/MecI/CopY family transcriptional regulator [Isosphaeraceae bacterium]|jgi:predicted transcriptional regulator
MSDPTPSLGELEIQVLRLVWEHQPCSERQVTDRIQGERAVARTTVLKTMQRLEEKGLLTRETGPGPVRFRATVSRERLLPALVRRFVDRVLGGTAGPLAAYLAESGTESLTPDDLRALRALVRKLDEGTTA